MTGQATVYVKLLGEGTDVWRPVPAIQDEPGVYRLVGSPEDEETWEFGPDSRVRCVLRITPEGQDLMAVSSVGGPSLPEAVVEAIKAFGLSRGMRPAERRSYLEKHHPEVLTSSDLKAVLRELRRTGVIEWRHSATFLPATASESAV